MGIMRHLLGSTPDYVEDMIVLILVQILNDPKYQLFYFLNEPFGQGLDMVGTVKRCS